MVQIVPGECIAVVGAGGKTSLCWLLTQDLVRRGSRVVFTTTTRIRQPAPGAFDVQVGGALRALAQLASQPWRTACLYASLDGPPDDTPLAESLMPVRHTKLAGFSGDGICYLYYSISTPKSLISFVVEADGARGLLIKAPAAHEPVIPPCATTVCVVANLEALGQPLDARIAHRPERIAALTGATIGQRVTPRLLIDLLAHPEGGLKSIPPGARKVAVLMQRDETTAHPAGADIVQALLSRGYDQAVVISPTRP